MRQSISCFSKTLAVLFVLFFLITAPLSILAFNIQHYLLSPDLYKTALAEQEFYTQIPGLVGEQIVTGISYNPCAEDPTQCENGAAPAEQPAEGGPPAYLAALDKDDWALMITTILPEGWLQTQVEGVIDGIFAYLDGKVDQPDLSISLREVRERLSGPQGVDAILLIVEKMPACSSEQEDAAIAMLTDPVTPDIPECAPSASAIEGARDDIQRVLTQVAAEIPDEAPIDLSELDQSLREPIDSPLGRDPLQIYRNFKRLAMFSPFIAIGLLALVLLFGARSLKGIFSWSGWPLLIVGLIVAPPAIFANSLLGEPFQTFIQQNLAGGISPQVGDLLIGLMQNIGKTIVRTITIEGALIFIAAVMLLVIGFVVGRLANQQLD